MLGVFGVLAPNNLLAKSGLESSLESVSSDREYWVNLLDRIASPLLNQISEGKLRSTMEVKVSPIGDSRHFSVAYLEAFGRLIAGMAPWLALPEDNTSESKLREKYKQQVLAGIAHGANPNSPDYFSWDSGAQPLVDAAFLAHALLRAPEALWFPLKEETKQQVIHEFKKLRRVKPNESNWLLFAAIVESFLMSIDEQYEPERIDYAFSRFEDWYIGDGWYSDGEKFSFDYYNGYVIQSMLLDSIAVNVEKGRILPEEYDITLKRMQRHGEQQERMISPEGTYAVYGRSATYRTGAFQTLAQLAWMEKLPESLTPAQVRSALTAVKKNVFIDSTFTKEGWLTLGLVGDLQDGMADSYSNTGSMYLTSLSFLPLGLPASHEFWTAPAEEWTMKKLWQGKPVKRDYKVGY